METTKPLGAHLMNSTEEKIWNGEYIEMMKLLHRELRARRVKRSTIPGKLGNSFILLVVPAPLSN